MKNLNLMHFLSITYQRPIYQMISLDWLFIENLYDRYGNYPAEVTNLFNLLTIKIKSLTLGISKINIKRNFIDITFKKASQKILDNLIQMTQEKIIKMKSSRSIQIKNNENEDLFYTVNLFYKKLGLK